MCSGKGYGGGSIVRQVRCHSMLRNRENQDVSQLFGTFLSEIFIWTSPCTSERRLSGSRVLSSLHIKSEQTAVSYKPISVFGHKVMNNNNVIDKCSALHPFTNGLAVGITLRVGDTWTYEQSTQGLGHFLNRAHRHCKGRRQASDIFSPWSLSWWISPNPFFVPL